ncbi:MAG: SEC-C metal-binding domain-containing protein [Desulfobacterales bacterium]
MKTGRNAPCPCGSGKKYKKCCLAKTDPPSQALYYQRLSEAHDRLAKRLLDFSTKTFGPGSIDVAMDEFLLWPDDEDEMDEEVLDLIGPLFWPWFFFNWVYDAQAADVSLALPEGQTLAELYAQSRSRKLDPLEKRLIEKANRAPCSFFEVVSVDPGKGMKLQDILKSTVIRVQERSGSEYVQSADLLFGRVVSVDGVGMIIGLAPTVIPPSRKLEIIELRKQLRSRQSQISDEALAEWEVEIRALYFRINQGLHAMPEIRNSDGDPMEIHRLIYEIASAHEAFEKLRDLCTTLDDEELHADAKQDDAGRILRVEFPWDRQGHALSGG